MKNADNLVSTTAVERALEALRRRRAEMERQMTALQQQIAADREEEQLLARILAVRRGESLAKPASVSRVLSLQRPSDVQEADTPVQAVFEELTAAGRPLHISDLMRLLSIRKVAIPGAGTQANLIIYLRRDPRFIRTSRGMYGLAEWGIEAMPPIRKRKRRRRGTRATQ